MHFQTKWKGFPFSEATWEPSASILSASGLSHEVFWHHRQENELLKLFQKRRRRLPNNLPGLRRSRIPVARMPQPALARRRCAIIYMSRATPWRGLNMAWPEHGVA
jgi:hypothetical protein